MVLTIIFKKTPVINFVVPRPFLIENQLIIVPRPIQTLMRNVFLRTCRSAKQQQNKCKNAKISPHDLN